jgi:hypothetical protein
MEWSLRTDGSRGKRSTQWSMRFDVGQDVPSVVSAPLPPLKQDGTGGRLFHRLRGAQSPHFIGDAAGAVLRRSAAAI